MGSIQAVIITHHINIQYFCVTDCIQSKELVIAYCPTNEMLADMFTKPFQGAAFHHFWAAVLNLQEDEYICPAMAPILGHRSALGNECTKTNGGWTGESKDLDGRKQMLRQMAKVNVETKNEANAHCF